jgi:hypothetical protein
MKLVGFGCSFTFGSELYAPSVDLDDYRSNIKYREDRCWLGLLGHRFKCSSVDNFSQPANSNFAIGQQVANYLLTTPYDPEVVVCVGWTDPARMSWYSNNKWTHNGFIVGSNYSQSYKEWVVNTTDDDHTVVSNNAKFSVNSMCKHRSTPLMQFSALGSKEHQSYDEYFLNGSTMQHYLEKKQIELNMNYFAEGGHPNEAGHVKFVDIMSEWIEAKKLL